MKNVQVIDGATNCTYPIYAFTDEEFSEFFPGSGQDIEFIKDAFKRIGSEQAIKILTEVWRRPVKKPDAIGIHGTLFYQLEIKKEYYPNKSEKDVEGPPHSPLQVSRPL